MKPFDQDLLLARQRRRLHLLLLTLVIFAIALLVAGVVLFSRGIKVQVLPEEITIQAQIAVQQGWAIAYNATVWSISRKTVLRVTAPKYADEIVTIDAREKKRTVSVTLQPLPGVLRITTLPEVAGMQWQFAEETITGAVFAQELPADSHRVSYRHPWYRSGELQVTLGPQEKKEIELKVERVRGSIDLDSQPAGATITWDGTPIGKTPMQWQREGGEYELRISLAEYQSIADTISVTEQQPKPTRKYLLQPLQASLDIIVTPAGGTLLVNGVQRKPGRLRLPAGQEYLISYARPGYIAEGMSVRLQAEEEKKIQIRLQKQKVTASPPAQKKATVSTQPRPAGNSYQTKTGGTMQLFRPRNTTFTLGAARHEEGQRANELLRTVRLKRPFYAGVYELQQAEYRQFDSSYSVTDPRHPVFSISWLQAAQFCNWLSQQEGLDPFYRIENGAYAGFRATAQGYRLLTEAEWEWLARKQGKSQPSRFVWGNNVVIQKKTANIADESTRGSLQSFVPGYNDGFAEHAPVASFRREAAGLYDQGGNVSEWVHDFYSVQPVQETLTDPLGAQRGSAHVVKGASWRSGTLTELRPVFREGISQARDDIGFRIARYAE